jgi:hypothetical protein
MHACLLHIYNDAFTLFVLIVIYPRKLVMVTCELLTQNPHPAPRTQQAEQAGLTHKQISERASHFS